MKGNSSSAARCESATAGDRRGAQRTLTVCRVVKVERSGSEALARCRNISDGGMKLELKMPLHLGEEIVVQFAPGTAISGKVVWTNGDACGVAFDRTIDCAQLLSQSAQEKSTDDRRSPRIRTNLAARVAIDGRVQPTTIHNMSQQGMLVSHEGQFQRGMGVTVLLPDGSEKAALVQWTHEHFAGLFLLDRFGVLELADVAMPDKLTAR